MLNQSKLICQGVCFYFKVILVTNWLIDVDFLHVTGHV